MRAKSVNENQQFNRGSDPKASMGIGIRNYKDYLNMKIRQIYPNENPEKNSMSSGGNIMRDLKAGVLGRLQTRY